MFYFNHSTYKFKKMKVYVALFLIITATCAKYLVESKTYYIFTLTPLNWHASFLDCMSRDLQLATVNSAVEQLAFEQAMKDANAIKELVWLAGTDLAQEGKFVWMTTGRPVSYSNWLTGQPSNSGGVEHCLHVWNSEGFGVWNDAKCSDRMYYACEDKIQAGQKTDVNVNIFTN